MNITAMEMLREMGLTPIWKSRAQHSSENETERAAGWVFEWSVPGNADWIFLHEPCFDEHAVDQNRLLTSILAATHRLGVEAGAGFLLPADSAINEQSSALNALMQYSTAVVIVLGEDIAAQLPKGSMTAAAISVVSGPSLSAMLRDGENKARLWDSLCLAARSTFR